MTPSRSRSSSVFHLLLLIAFICGLSTEVSAFEVRRAINIAQWFTWPRYEAPPGTGISWPPYKKDPRPPSTADLRELKSAGFDTVRLPVDPAPFFVFEGERREAVYRILFDAIERIQFAGLNVIVDLHPNSRHAVWGQLAVVKGPDAPAFRALADVAEEMARRLSREDQRRVALELINEPRLKCKGEEQSRWEELLGHLVKRARSAAPKLALVVTGSCISTIDGLLALDAKRLNDPNLIYTFHFYEPFSFTHQGAAFIPWPDKYLDEVPWPANARPIDRSLSRIEEHVGKATKLSAMDRTKAVFGARINLQRFVASGAGKKTIEDRFALVARWAKENDVAPSRILIGEFGVLRKKGNAPGALCADRVRWLRDVQSAAERLGFAWAYFSYDGPFALIRDERSRKLDASILSAIGLMKNNAPCDDD